MSRDEANATTIDQQEQQVDGSKVEFETAWRFYSTQPISDTNYQNLIVPLEEFATVQEFWKCFSSLPTLGSLKQKEKIWMMRKVAGKFIEPMWEDPENSLGGALSLRVKEEDANEFWQCLALGVIGEQFEQCMQDDEICGINVSKRFNSFLFQIWNRNKLSPSVKNLETRVKELTPTIALSDKPYYKSHK